MIVVINGSKVEFSFKSEKAYMESIVNIFSVLDYESAECNELYHHFVDMVT